MYKVRALLTFSTVLLFFTEFIQASDIEKTRADSLTYQLYLKGEWDSLLMNGNLYLQRGVDFKTLRQRMGYAAFMKGNYIKSRSDYEKALRYDETDAISRLYLYYNGLYSSDENYMRYYAGLLPDTLKRYFKIRPFHWIEAVDLEYNYQAGSKSYSRSGSSFYRLGVNSELGYRLSFYQTISGFKQTFYDNYQVNQNEYYAVLTWNFTPRFSLSEGFHYANSKVDTDTYHTHVLYSKLAYSKLFIDISLANATFLGTANHQNQLTLHSGFSIYQLKKMYLYSDFSYLNNSDNTNWVFKQGIGVVPFTRIWLELALTEGAQKNYVDMNGVYLYNSIDYSTFKLGGTLFYYLNKHLTLYGNYINDLRYITESNINQSYHQHSITTGIIWKP